MPLQKCGVGSPFQGIATGPPIEPFLPDPFDSLIELPYTVGIRRTSVILIVASKLPVESLLLLLDRTWRASTRSNPWPAHDGLDLLELEPELAKKEDLLEREQ